MFELLNANTVAPIAIEQAEKKQTNGKTFLQQYESAPEKFRKICDELRDFALSIGDDVSESTLKLYSAFKKIKNFCTMEIYQSKVLVNFRLNPDDFKLNDELRDVRTIGHWGCGDLQLIITSDSQLNIAKELIHKAYEEN